MKKQVKRRSETEGSVSSLKENLAKYFYDLSKLVFGATAIQHFTLVFTEEGYTNILLLLEFGIGMIITAAFAVIASKLLKS